MNVRFSNAGLAVLVGTSVSFSHVDSHGAQAPAQTVVLPNQQGGGAWKRLHLPLFQPFEYRKTARDPFIDPSVLATLLGAKKQDIVSRPKPIDDYAGELQRLLGTQYAVQGIAYDPGATMALMGGRICRVGERIALKVGGEEAETAPPGPAGASAGTAIQPKTLEERLYATSRYWGLNLERDLRLGQLRLTIRSISPEAVYLKLPGATQDLVLAYAKNLDLETTEYASAYGPAASGSGHKPTKAAPATQSPAAKPADAAKSIQSAVVKPADAAK